MNIKPICLIAAVALIAHAGSASALTLDIGVRTISVGFSDSAGTPVAAASDDESVFNDAPYTRNLSAFIGGSGFLANVGMNQVGFFGIEASAITSGRLTTSVSVLETYRNDQAFAVDVRSSFIVVDGFLDMVARTGGTLIFDLAVGEFPFGNFNNQSVLTGSDTFQASFSDTGDSLGASQSGVGGPATIPFSINEIDLGRLEPGDSIDYFYSLSIVLDADVLEIASWTFLDPSATSTLASPTLVSASPAAAVPLPATLPLLAGAIVVLGAAARLRA